LAREPEADQGAAFSHVVTAAGERVTFGGAYAVLPYVYQGGVETYGWLTGAMQLRPLPGQARPG